MQSQPNASGPSRRGDLLDKCFHCGHPYAVHVGSIINTKRLCSIVGCGCSGIPLDELPDELFVSPQYRDWITNLIDHPSHYGGPDNPYEAIKVIEAWDLNFNLGNVVKYICRESHEAGLEDLKKALWYLQHEIENREES